MFGKRQKKSLWDYVTEHEPYHPIEELKTPKYADGTVSVEHKELEADLAEYWDLLHPLVADFVNSYATTYEKISSEIEESRESLVAARRSLTFEQENVNELSDTVRQITGQLQNEMVMRKDAEERLKDERDMLQNQFNEEKRALQLIAESKLAEGLTLDSIMEEVNKSVGSSEEIKRYKMKIEELENKIKAEREENERIQGELSTSFMEKITRYDEMIQNLKKRLGED
ncbi:MAG: hypothetical protein IH840_06820 [Candidatus Heimdallarchaeota archaeon]|nr:hypothetical protein [Candidatus Heimdallarchaeota archaeon]